VDEVKRLLVSGGAGFIGSHLIDRLLENGTEVVCFDNFDDFYDPRIKRENIKPYLKKKNFKLVEGDLRNREFLKKLFKEDKIARIIHLAARAGVRASLKDPILYEEVNVKGTLNLLELAKEYGVEQFIFASSSSVYGAKTRVPFKEEERLGPPLSPYAVSKRGGELLSYTYSHLYDLPVTILRLFTVYGPRQRPEMAIHKFTRLIDEDREIPMFGEGTSRRDYTYISDIIEGIIRALEKKFAYEIFNLGNSHTLELKD
jgi:UDP-glucuronate 4-epimerase